jgi:hypothetical protein
MRLLQFQIAECTAPRFSIGLLAGDRVGLGHLLSLLLTTSYSLGLFRFKPVAFYWILESHFVFERHPTLLLSQGLGQRTEGLLVLCFEFGT